MIPWRPLLVFSAISVGVSIAIAALCARLGWTVSSPAWSVLVPIVMWAPALARIVARRTVDRRFSSTLPLRRWGVTGAQVVLWPLVYPLSLLLFAIGDLPVTFIMARETYRARSLWPAVFFHSFHNTISQWLFPKFFSVSEDRLWLTGEMGLLPVSAYVVLGGALYLWMRWRGLSWTAFAKSSVFHSLPARDV